MGSLKQLRFGPDGIGGWNKADRGVGLRNRGSAPLGSGAPRRGQGEGNDGLAAAAGGGFQLG